MLQQIYPSTTHPYQFELNKDFNFRLHITFRVKKQVFVKMSMVILTLLI